MRVFVTGATGFVGSAVVGELLDAGHEVVGLARSDRAASLLAAAGAGVLRGSLEDLDSLRRGASDAEGVVHTAYIHDFSENNDAAAYARTDRAAIDAMGDALSGSDRPLVVTAGLPLVEPGRIATEEDANSDNPPYPRVSEPAAMAMAGRGVRVSVVRLPPTVHGVGDHAFVPALIDIARARGRAAYVGEGENRWAAVHRLDAARLFRLALEYAPAGTRLNAVAEEGVPLRDIAGAIGTHLDIPVVSLPAEQAGEHFGLFATFVSIDVYASSETTRKQFDWHPEHPGLLADLGEGHYFNG